MDLVHVGLDEQDYSTLVNGGVIVKKVKSIDHPEESTTTEVHIRLQDIGFHRMQAHLAAAIAKAMG